MSYININNITSGSVTDPNSTTVLSLLGSNDNSLYANIDLAKYSTVKPGARISFMDDNNHSYSWNLLTKQPGSADNDLVSRFFVSSDGKVGINTTTPQVPLQISDSAILNVSGGVYFDNGSNNLQNLNGTSNVSILAANYVAGQGFLSYSDERIKENIQSIESDTLSKLDNLNVVQYSFKDKGLYGGNQKIGLIAQDVRNVFPDATNTTKKTVPDIFKIATINNQQQLFLENHNLEANDNIRILVLSNVDNKIQILKVKVLQVLDQNTFTLNTKLDFNITHVFVYGREVDDFHELDYSYIYNLTVLAVQELRKQVAELTQKIKDIQNEIDALRNAQAST